MDRTALRQRLLIQIGKIKSQLAERKMGCCTDQRFCMFDDLLQYAAFVE